MRRNTIAVASLIVSMAAIGSVTNRLAAADKDQAGAKAGIEFFEKKIRPVLVKHCYECHAVGAEKIRGALLLDSRVASRKGGESGPAVVPGNIDESLLIDAIRYDGLEMPPKGRLPVQVVADFVKWIQMGAPDPREGELAPVTQDEIDFEKAKQFWAFQRPRSSSPPHVTDTDWPKDNIDHFVLAELEQHGLSPVEDAEQRTWLRRVSFDLTGLPPSPEEVHEFLHDAAPTAKGRVVDRLLASPRFGEHWGRHWLDVSRYADSNGGDINLTFHNAWRFRDYVVDSFNKDKPFGQFIVEQLAGDLLPYENDDQRAEQLIASGFLVVGPKMLSERDKEKLYMDVVDEQLDTVGRTFLGLTLGCARCHDHKFDPIPTRDYYALAGIFRSTVTVQGIRMDNVNVSGWIERPLPISPEHQLADLKTSTPPPAPFAMAPQDRDAPADCEICIRGEPHNRAASVPRGFLRVLDVEHENSISPGQSGRVELARWIADAGNPLTSRVIVNRIWHHLFGTGLVRSVDNLGELGERPSHPELLDQLSVEFINQGSSVKSLIRQIVLSRVYQLGSYQDENAMAVDPQARLLWRHNRRRLNAESIRDAMLFAGDLLDLRIGGSSVIGLEEQAIPNNPKDKTGQLSIDSSTRRSIYLPLVRNNLPDILTVFDLADPDVVVGARSVTTVPAQALMMMNSDTIKRFAQAIATRALDHGESDDRSRLRMIYEFTIGRVPSDSESARALDYTQRTPDDESDLNAKIQAWADFCHALLASTEFRYLE